MTSERWQQVKQVFQTALEREFHERPAYLGMVCADDATLRAEVESLLLAYEQAPQFFEQPASALIAPWFAEDLAESLQGKLIGPYRLQHELGRGGMGVVYLAKRDDQQFDKRVALKLIKRGMDTDDILRRFRQERQTLATLDHPHIAQLLDGGATAEGLPYFVMEHVDGLPIDVYCDRHRLNTAARLQLFRLVCAAVHHAHQNLIVHRDLKPGNILVTAEGLPKLLDFGLAKFVHQDPQRQSQAVTMPGARLMTPEYASPEQVRGEPVTTASDVYALGVLLYKLLTGHRPYQLTAASAQEIDRVICEHQPEKPSTAISRLEQVGEGATPDKLTPETVSLTREGSPARLRRRLRGDLDNIVLMALRKEPQRRYASVERFSEDIRRHLAGLPVAAHQDTLAYRSFKFASRHKAGVAAAALMLLIVLAAIAGVGWQARIALQERDRARLESAKAQQINRFLQEMLGAVDPMKSGTDVKDLKVEEALAIAARRVDQELSEQPEIAAEVRTTIGITYQNLGHYDRADSLLQKALVTRRQLFGEEHQQVAASIKHMAVLRHYQGDLKEAEALFAQALALYRRLGLQHTHGFAEALNDYGILLNDHGHYRQGEILFHEARAIYVRLYGQSHQDVASTLNNQAYALHGIGRLDSAAMLYREALAVYTQIYGAQHPDLAHTLNNLAFVLVDQGELGAATTLFQQSLAMRRKLLGEDHPEVATAVHNLAGILYLQKEYQQAAVMIREAIVAWQRTLPENHPSLANSLFWQGRILIALGEGQKAEVSLRRALEIRQKVYAPHHFLIAKARVELGSGLLKQQRYREAEALLREGCAALQASPGDQTQSVRECRQLLADLYKAWGKPENAARIDSLSFRQR